MADPMRTVSFKLTPLLDDALSDLARRRRSSRSALVREALELFAQDKDQSVTARVDALIGGVEGARDLSSNPKYLFRYGK
ncbi:MAG: ribbon-helix-helix protein, CopG family [Gemmatimonadaceae bacterium]